MVPSVTKVIPHKDFTLHLTFDNGEYGILDMKPYFDFGVFQGLKEYAHFQQVRVSFDTIEWEGGIDLDPEFVYSKCQVTV